MFADKPHPSFEVQPAPGDRVWRYMDLPRYLGMLQDQALHFVRVDQMSDLWEAAFGPVNARLRPIIYREHWDVLGRQLPMFRDFVRTHIHINCWHLSDVESAAMWELYQRDGRGVAVATTWGRLTGSITSHRDIYGGKVAYVDYRSTWIPENNLFAPVMYKRTSYSHEREVRLAMSTGKAAPNPAPGTTGISEPEAPVLAIEVDIDSLVEQVYVAPDAPPWFHQVVEKVTRRYGHSFPVLHSDLASDPVA